MKRLLLSLLFAGSLFLPSVSFASSLTTFQDKVLFQPDSNVYRLRQVTKPWQLIGLPSNLVPENYEVINGEIFLIGKIVAKKFLFRSVDGLRFNAVPLGESDDLKLKKVGQYILVAQRNSTVNFYRIDNSQPVKDISSPLLTSIDQIDQLADNHDELTLISQSADVKVSVYRNNIWQTVAALDCTSSDFITQPMVAIDCGSQVYYYAAQGSWQPLFPQPIRAMVSDKHLLAQSATEQSKFYTFDGTTLLTLVLTGFGDPATIQLLTHGSRYFIRGTQLWEINPVMTSGLLSVDLNPNAIVVPTMGDSRLYLRTTGRDVYSDQIGTWSLMTVAGDYSRAMKTDNGYLLWKYGGSMTQFGASNSSAYQLVATSWAASSQIQEIIRYGGITFLYLLNSSSKPNLYKTTDFSQWTRITLPTEPIRAVTIAEARTLPAGSLVSVYGVTSVLPGVVAADVMYLQDQTGGIQLFLSATKGILPVKLHYDAEAIGSISTSQVKRLTLDTLGDLLIGAPNSLVLPVVSADLAATELGKTAQISATVNSVTSDYLNLKLVTGNLRLRYKQLSTEYQALDQGTFPAIVDYNSSSGQVESWSLGGDLLVARPEEPAPLTPQPEPEEVVENVHSETLSPQKTVAIIAKPAASKPKPAVKKRAPPTAAVTKTTQIKTGTVPAVVAETNEALVAPASVTKSDQTVPVPEALLLCFLSLVAGILSLRGRRFRQLFEA